jgi:hypothetical protein
MAALGAHAGEPSGADAGAADGSGGGFASVGERAPDVHARASAVSALSSAGVQLDRRVAEYLSLRQTLRGTRRANANDELLAAERGEQGGSYPGDRDAEPLEQRLEGGIGERGDSGEPTGASEGVAQAYDEFERLLAQRDEWTPPEGEPRPERDTKRAVDPRWLANQQFRAQPDS